MPCVYIILFAYTYFTNCCYYHVYLFIKQSPSVKLCYQILTDYFYTYEIVFILKGSYQKPHLYPIFVTDEI